MLDTVGEEVGVDIGVESEVVEWAVRFLKDIVYMLLLPFLLLGCRGLLEVGAVEGALRIRMRRRGVPIFCSYLTLLLGLYFPMLQRSSYRRRRGVRCRLLAMQIGFRLIVFRPLLSVLFFVLFLILLLAGAVD